MVSEEGPEGLLPDHVYGSPLTAARNYAHRGRSRLIVEAGELSDQVAFDPDREQCHPSIIAVGGDADLAGQEDEHMPTDIAFVQKCLFVVVRACDPGSK
ncbi:hypothetical protein GCM10027569_09780 [Flindersiella endophytica]